MRYYNSALTLFLIAGLFSVSGCRHQGIPLDFGQGTGHCRLITIDHPTRPEYGRTSLYYDAQGRLARVIGLAPYTRPAIFSYHDSTIIVSYLDNNGIKIGQDSIIINAQGNIAYDGAGLNPASLGYERIFYYDQIGQLNRADTKQLGQVVASHYYTWSNGNMVVDSFGPGKKLDYSYYDVGFQYANQQQLADYLNLGVVTWKPRKLVSSFASGSPASIVEHAYTFDEEGKVLTDSLYNISSRSGYLTTFGYECR